MRSPFKDLQEYFLKKWFFFIQILTIPANIIFSCLLQLVVERPPAFKTTHGMLIIANHQSKIDPFLISYHIGIRNILTTIPIRYPVDHKYISKPFIGFCIRLLGGYDIGGNHMERLKKLVFTRNLFHRGYTVVLFPEGKITRDSDMVDEFKRGASALFNENYPVVFVRLTGLNTKHRFHFWKKSCTKLSYSVPLGSDVSREKKIETMIEFFYITENNHKENICLQ
ncbi:1-acyl-sn-glycerol-3-phosphate acyltransferase [Candidatus Kaiserbacteria bacterium]|nr:MAG: 1-acyl-sn-glycerol-3-phosphate acyltransferase [Candidatus Kaiserbacteria bacterium]